MPHKLSEPLSEVDYRCTCSDCKKYRSSPTYKLLVACYNCGEKHIGKFRKGEKPNIFAECPHCGVSRLTFGTAKEARLAGATNEQTE